MSETVRSTTRVVGFTDPELDFQLLRQRGSAAYGGASVGECLTVAARIRERGPGAWTDAFAELADAQRADADAAATVGHRGHARDRYLHASNSYRSTGSRTSWAGPFRNGVGLRRRGRMTRMVGFLLRAALTGFALWVVTLVVPGIYFDGGQSTLQDIGIIFVVGLIFGVVNAIIKPIVQFISIPLYILTLGLIHVVINALMLWITAWITANTTHWGLRIDDFWWTAIWAAIVLSIVSWALSVIFRDTSHA